MDDMILKVKCPNDTKECTVAGGEIMESMVLLGDEEQNMQCMKTHIKPFHDDFKEVCVETNKGRYWAPSVFTTENYMVVPVVDGELKWRVYAQADPATEVVMPTFSDAFKMVEKLENLIGEQIQQQTNS